MEGQPQGEPMSDSLRRIAEKYGGFPKPRTVDDINAALDEASLENALPPEADLLKNSLTPKERKAQGRLNLGPRA